MRYKKVTLMTAMEEWRRKAEVRGFSPKTVKNTQVFFRMIVRFVAPETELKKITADRYERLVAKMWGAGYAPETVYDLNATLRKLINLAWRRGLVRENILGKADNLRPIPQKAGRVIPEVEFLKMMQWFEGRKYVRNGVDVYKKYRFLLTLLYRTGMRIGEALALTPDDFIVGDNGVWRLRIEKSYLREFELVKTTKNRKTREVPLDGEVFGRFLREMGANEARAKTAQANRGGTSGRIFDFSPQAVRRMLARICAEQGLPRYKLHEFRHTFVSNLVRGHVPLPVVAQVSGDTQTTLLRRYSHMFPGDEELILRTFAGCASEYAAQPKGHGA